MRNLCLTCQSLRHITVPRLYCRVEFTIDEGPNLKLVSFCNRSNPGHHHVRALIFRATSHQKLRDSELPELYMRLVIEILPEHVLETV